MTSFQLVTVRWRLSHPAEAAVAGLVVDVVMVDMDVEQIQHLAVIVTALVKGESWSQTPVKLTDLGGHVMEPAGRVFVVRRDRA